MKVENMNKGELVNERSKIFKTKKDAQAAVNCVLSSITNAIESIKENVGGVLINDHS